MEQVSVSEWLTPSGRTRPLKDGELTGQRQPVERVYCCQKSDMKEPWFLGSNRVDISAAKALHLYGQRWASKPVFVTSRTINLAWEWARSGSKVQCVATGYFCSVH